MIDTAWQAGPQGATTHTAHNLQKKEAKQCYIMVDTAGQAAQLARHTHLAHDLHAGCLQ
jgi:hypothetical protein